MNSYREQTERRKAQKKEWELAGTKLGNILGIEKTDDREDKATDDTMDYREGQKFADHMKVDQEKKSEFAKSKTLKQQREGRKRSEEDFDAQHKGKMQRREGRS